MKEITGNLWYYPADYRIITTNGTVKTNGKLVMGRGCALEAKKLYPDLDSELGMLVDHNGNHVHLLEHYKLFTFPVKHNWYEKASVELIKRSLEEFTNKLLPKVNYVMPKPGCGNGHLDWKDIRPLFIYLPDNVAIIDFV